MTDLEFATLVARAAKVDIEIKRLDVDNFNASRGEYRLQVTCPVARAVSVASHGRTHVAPQFLIHVPGSTNVPRPVGCQQLATEIRVILQSEMRGAAVVEIQRGKSLAR